MATLLLTISGGPNTVTIALRAMRRHIHLIRNPDKLSTKLRNCLLFSQPSNRPCAPTLHRFFTSRLRSSETRNQLSINHRNRTP